MKSAALSRAFCILSATATSTSSASFYIEAYIAANTSASPYETIETLREEIRRKDEQIAGLVQRDATVSKCKTENLELTDEIASLRETIKAQEELIRQLRGNPNVLQTKRR